MTKFRALWKTRNIVCRISIWIIVLSSGMHTLEFTIWTRFSKLPVITGPVKLFCFPF